MMLKGLQFVLMAEPDMEVVGTASTGEGAVALFRRVRPDVTIMDLMLGPSMDGISAIQMIRTESPDAKIVVLTVQSEEESIYRALTAGASTYLLKGAIAQELTSTIRTVYGGVKVIPPEIGRKLAHRIAQPDLTRREVELLQLIAEGLRNKEIANRLAISEQTVMSHIKSVFQKLNVNDRTKAVTIAIRRGIITVPE